MCPRAGQRAVRTTAGSITTVKREEPTMQEQRTDGLIYTMLVLAAAAAIFSSPEHPSGLIQQVESLMLTASISDATMAAAALGDVRVLDVPP
ncbi:MAG: hypothetical protein QOD93_2410 [Acetobacteraceae bacterium]|jgi:hypothetical protein|nr:hypothetical protein [Acetobacteraceae bacterium]